MPDVVFYLRVSPRQFIECNFQKHATLDYWESGMDLELSRGMFQNFMKYQGLLQAEFERMQQVYDFDILNGNRSIRAVAKDFQARVEPILRKERRMNSSVQRVAGRAPSTPRPAVTGRNGRDSRKSMDIELNRLKSLFREMVENYAAKVEGEIAQLQEVMQENGQENGRKEAIQAMMTSIRQLKVKPEKGRRRDFKRIHDLVQEMRRLTEAW